MAGDKLVSDSQYYSIGQNTKITLEVIIGNSQVGGSVVLYNNAQISGSNIFSINNAAPLGMIKVVTTAMDINPSTNTIPVTFQLNGGTEPKSFSYSPTVDHDNAQAIFSINFLLIA